MRCSIKHYPALKPVKTLFLNIYDVQGKIRKAWDFIHYCGINKNRFINLYQQLVLTMHILQVQFCTRPYDNDNDNEFIFQFVQVVYINTIYEYINQ